MLRLQGWSICVCFSLPSSLTLSRRTVAAQSPNTASVIVVVVDQTGAGVKDAKVSVVNTATGAVRESVSGSDGSATIPALSLTGTYTVGVSKDGFGNEELKDIALRSGETATLTVKLLVGSGKAEVTVFGTAEGVRADAQIGRRLESSQIDETPILGRKVTSLPLLNAAFRQAKGTGDLFVNQTYFVTGAGSRRTTTVTLDGANNDEAWGRQTMIATVPLGAVQEMTVLSNAFSSEFGWTAGPALNIVTKSGTNGLHGEALYLGRPGDMQAKTFSTKGFCPPSVSSCVTPSTLTAINPVDVPDALSQYSGSIGGALIKDKTFFFATGDYTRQNRTAFLSSTLPAFLLPANGNLAYEGHYRQTSVQRTPGPQAHIEPEPDVSHERRSLSRRQPAGRRRRHERAQRRARVRAALVDGAAQSHRRTQRESSQRGANRLSPWRSGHALGGAEPFHHLHARRVRTLYDRTVAAFQPLRVSDSVLRHADLVARQAPRALRRKSGPSPLGRYRQRARHRGARNVHLQQHHHRALRSIDSGQRAAYTQPIDFGINSYKLKQRLYSGFVQDSIHLRRDFTIDLGLRYDRQTLTNATKDFGPRVGFGWNPNGDSRWSIRGGYGMYYTQIQSNLIASYLVNGLDGLTTYTATPGQFGFPTCLTGSCLPLSFDPRDSAGFAIARPRYHHSGGPAGLLPGAVQQVRTELRPLAELPR